MSHWANLSRGLRLARERHAELGSSRRLLVERSAARECLHESVRFMSPPRPIVRGVLSGSSAWRKAAKGKRSRRVNAVRLLLPTPASALAKACRSRIDA
jgi:hypothetical protein